MIAERIYNGETAEELGLSQTAYDSRKQTLDAYLKHVGNVFDPQEYLDWLQKNQDRGLPSLLQQAKNLSKETVKFIVKGAPKVSEEEARRRIALCETCTFWVEEGFMTVAGIQMSVKRRCRKCGCAMDLKATWATTKCEIGKW
jgi:hypothetical protein